MDEKGENKVDRLRKAEHKLEHVMVLLTQLSKTLEEQPGLAMRVSQQARTVLWDLEEVLHKYRSDLVQEQIRIRNEHEKEL